jgi:hypothetical protein
MAPIDRPMMTTKEFQLLHPSGLHISRDLSEISFLDSAVGQDAPRTDMHTGWVWYRLPPFPDSDITVGISLGFNAGKLADVSLTDTDLKYGSGWSEWSEDKERLRARNIGEWLVRKGFAVGSHSWGEVWAGFDAKGGFGGAKVRYT